MSEIGDNQVSHQCVGMGQQGIKPLPLLSFILIFPSLRLGEMLAQYLNGPSPRLNDQCLLCLDVQTQMETGAPELFQIMNSTCTCSCALVILNTDPMKLTTHLLSLIESRYGRKWRLRTLISAICFKFHRFQLPSSPCHIQIRRY